MRTKIVLWVVWAINFGGAQIIWGVTSEPVTWKYFLGMMCIALAFIASYLLGYFDGQLSRVNRKKIKITRTYYI